MSPLSSGTLLAVWERGRNQPVIERALQLLEPAFPGDPAALPIGQRDERLLRVRAAVFGPRLQSVARCPQCGEKLEFEFATGDLLTGADSRTLSVMEEGREISVRPADSNDLRAAIAAGSPEAAYRVLLERCVTCAEPIPERARATVIELMAKADPQANLQLELACPGCGNAWQEVFDIVSFFWTEIESWAYRTLREVHILAERYGWSEAAILALSPWRRRFYLELIAQ